MLYLLDELDFARDTVVDVASCNGPDGSSARTFDGEMPDMGMSGPTAARLD